MYIERVPNRTSRPALLLREAWREGKTIRKRTLANLTDWPAAKVEAFRRLLRGEAGSAPEAVFAIERSVPHGHVAAILGTVRRLGLESLLAAKRCRARDLVLALLVERLLHPCSKLATTRLWDTTTLAEELGVQAATEDEMYAAMDWLAARQARIEQKLAARHLAEGDRVFYDVSSSFYEGRTCPLAQFGHDRDGKHGLPVIIDNTVLTPALFRPFDYGANIIVHSATKYIGGHSDVIGGAIIAAAPAIIFAFYKIFGLDSNSAVGVGNF